MSENSGKCYHFHTYDFMNDPTFLKGWDKIQLLAEGDPLDKQRKLLQAKVFYYSQTFEPITTEEYKDWMTKTCSDIAKGRYGTSTAEDVNLSDTERGLQDLSLDKDAKTRTNTGRIVNSDKTYQEKKSAKENLIDDMTSPEATNRDPKYPASFSEIAKLIEKGEKIPGVEQLNIKPTNTEPTPSTHERVTKPWEKS